MSCGASKTTVGDRTFWKEICRNCNFIHSTPWQSVISSPLPMIFFTSLANWHSRPARIISIHLIPHYDSIRITPNFNAVFINHLLGIPRDFHRPLRIRLTKPGIFYRGRWTSTNISMLNKKTFNMSHPTIGKPYINPYVFRYQPKFFHISTHMFHIYISIYIYQPICFTWHWNHPCLVSFSPQPRSLGIGVPNTKSPGRGSGRTWCGSPGPYAKRGTRGRLCRHGDMGNDRENAATLWEWVNCIKFQS
jgi:hypothetical protein